MLLSRIGAASTAICVRKEREYDGWNDDLNGLNGEWVEDQSDNPVGFLFYT